MGLNRIDLVRCCRRTMPELNVFGLMGLMHHCFQRIRGARSNRSGLTIRLRIFGYLCAVVLAAGCQSRNSDVSEADTMLDSIAETSHGFSLVGTWTRVADSEGAIDQEKGIASTEAAEFSPDAKFIISGSKKGREVILWETVSGSKIWEKKWNEEIEAVAFSRDGSCVAIGGEDHTIKILNVRDGSIQKELSLNASVDGLRFSHKGDLLVGGDEHGLVHVWRTSDWSKMSTIVHGDEYGPVNGKQAVQADVNSIDFSQDDGYISSAGRNGLVKIWSASDMNLIRTLKGHTGSIKSARFSPDGKILASASASPDSSGDNSIRVWDIKSGDQLAEFKHVLGMEAVEFSPDGTFLLAGGREGGGYDAAEITQGFIYVYKIPVDPRKDPISLAKKYPVFRTEYLHFARGGKQLVSAHEDGTIRLWTVISND